MSGPDRSAAGPRFGLIADDLTGACDAGVQFAARGFSTLVRLDAPALADGAFDLVTLSTSSRNDAPPLAARKVRQACEAVLRERRGVIFKKIDSTLRGNLGAEIGATIDSCGFALALVAPAYPAMGRTLEGGALRVAGSAEHASANLHELLVAQGARQVVTFGREAWAQGPEALGEQLRTLPDGTIAALDSTCDGDLEAIARAGLQLRGRALLVGSAGLAAATAKILNEEFRGLPPVAPGAPATETVPGSSVFLMGSTHPVTQAQTDFLARHLPLVRIQLGANARREALEGLKSGRPVLVELEPGQGDDPRLKEFLEVLIPAAVRGITLSGGDTALAIVRALGASGIKLEQEVLPGIPFGRVMGGAAEGLAVVTKAGGFGSEDALVRVAEFLAFQKRTP